jgi:hypothetical protein
VWVTGSGSFEMSSGTISSNSASEGGGVQVAAGTFEMNNRTIGGTGTGNTAAGGGGVFVDSAGTFMMNSGTIGGASTSGLGNTANSSTGGGGVFIISTGTFKMTASAAYIRGNTAFAGGGMGVVNGGTFTMTGGTISGNTASEYGDEVSGGQTGDSGIFTMSGGTISGNTAKTGGGVGTSYNTAFIKTGGIIYGDDDNIHTPGSTENTATVATNLDTNGHAVFLQKLSPTAYYYRNETLTGADNISTADLQTNWTKRP